MLTDTKNNLRQVNMRIALDALWIILITITSLRCSSHRSDTFSPKEIFRTDHLIITQVAENTYEHTSFKLTNDFGNVPCNGLIVRNNNEVIIFDTPTNDETSEELIKWIRETLHCRINAIIPTHFHDDCLGGLKAFDDNDIPSYAYFKTIELAKESSLVAPENGFRDSIILKVGDENVIAKFFGEGHTKDNIVGYFPGENVVFGGCLVKEVGAGKGYLGDANLAEWAGTVEQIKKAYPNVKVIVPGHGAYGDQQLLDYTISLFRSQ